MAKTAAFFDLDGTLCTGHIWKGLSSYCRTNGVNMGVYYPFFFGHMALWLLYKARLLPERALVYRWGKDMAALTRGLSQTEAQEMFKWTVAQEITSTLREDVIHEMRWHQEQCHLVVPVSGAFQEVLDIVGQELGVKHIVGTKLKLRRRLYTGGIDGPFCFGQDKANMLQQRLDELEDDVDLSNSYAYADRYYDLPLLEMVGNPVAVYPDEKLKRHAQENSWKILEG